MKPKRDSVVNVIIGLQMAYIQFSDEDNIFRENCRLAMSYYRNCRKPDASSDNIVRILK